MNIQEIIVAVVPYVVMAVTVIGSIIKMFKEFRAVKREVVDMKSVDELKVQMKQVLQENYELKKHINELLTKIDHIERKTK